MPNRLQMAFKGGTSLSKVFGTIHRFSEDVDVTLDYRSLAPDLDPFALDISNTRRSKITKQLREHVRQHTTGTIRPYLEGRLAVEVSPEIYGVEIDEAGEKISVFYPSALGNSGDYVRDPVILEFGGRNITEPNVNRVVVPDIASELLDLAFPQANVDVLLAERTFWEKATLIHVECNRGEFRESAQRQSRHWYDLSMLATHEIGINAVQNRALLHDVVQHKKVFYNASYANYDACLTGQMRLVPVDEMLKPLAADYQEMIAAGMFYEAPSAFEEIIQTLAELENKINSNI